MRLGNNNFDHNDSHARMAKKAAHVFDASDYKRTTIEADTFESRKNDNFKADITIKYDEPSEESLNDPRYHIDFGSEAKKSKQGFFAGLFASETVEERRESKARIQKLVNKVKGNKQSLNSQKSLNTSFVRPGELAVA